MCSFCLALLIFSLNLLFTKHQLKKTQLKIFKATSQVQRDAWAQRNVGLPNVAFLLIVERCAMTY